MAISPTPAGLRVYAPLVDLAEKSEQELVAGLTDQELKTLDRIIAVMMENAMVRLAREQQATAEGLVEGPAATAAGGK